MAAANDRFSIRDYAARMRDVDLAKSWPFVGEKVEKPQLPPISVRRFRWWADELSEARSASLAAETKAAETPMDELLQNKNESIELQSPKSPPSKIIKKTTEDEKLRSPKPKTKLPKKRSIVELFASAPQIETVDLPVDIGEDKEDDETVVMRRRKGKRRKGTIKMEIHPLKKVKVSKSKLIRSGQRHLFQHPTNKKAEKTTDCVPESKKKSAKVKIFQKKDNILQTPNLTSSNNNVAKKLPVHRILKSKNRLSSARETRKINDSNTVKFIRRKITRNVTFSGKDAILGHGMNCSKIDLPQFKSLCKIFSDVLTKSSVMKNSSKVHELTAANGGKQLANSSVEDTNADVVYRTDEPSCQKNQSSDSLSNNNHKKLVNYGNSSFSRIEKASSAVVIDLNHTMETCNDSDRFNSSTENLSPNRTNSGDLETTHKKGSSTFAEFHPRGLPKISPVSITPTAQNFVPSSTAADLLTSMKNYRPHSPTPCLKACNDKKEKPCWQYSDVDMKCCYHIPKNQSEHHCSPDDMLSNDICYSMGCNKFMGSAFLSNAESTSKSKSAGEDLIRLPYNKQGELIQIHPGTMFVGPCTKQNMDFAYSHGFYANKKVEPDINVDHLKIMKDNDPDVASYQIDRLVWCQNQRYPNSERKITELFGPKRLNIQNNAWSKSNYEFLHSQANKTKPSFHDGRSDNAALDIFKKIDLPGKYSLACQLEPVVKPTIRLMGQNVVVDASNGDFQSSMPEKYLSKQRTLPEFVANKCRSSTGCLHKLYDPPPIFYHATGHVEPQFDLHIDDNGCENLSRFSTTQNNTFKVFADSHNAILNKTDKFMGNIISGEEPTRHQYYPTIASYQQNSQQNTLLNSTHCNHSQGVSSHTFVTPQLPQSQIRYNFHENLFQPVHTQTREELPPWLLQAKHKKWNQSPYSDPIELSQPSRFSGTNLIPQLSPYNMPMDPLPLDNISPAKTFTFAPNSSQSSFISVVTANNSVSEVTMSNAIKNKEKERSYSNFTGFSSPVEAHKFQKRSARGDDVLMNSVKIPHFGKQADYGIPVEPQGANLSGDHKLLDHATALDIQKAVYEVDELSNAESSSYSRLDKESTVGATELDSEAKHGLKSIQKIDDENFKPSHPTTNFPCKSTPGKLLSPQKQIVKMYES